MSDAAYPDQNQRLVVWPEDWPEPTRGATAAPLMGPTEFEALKADIKRRGLQEKIRLTPEGKISEGRNRYRALRDLGHTHEEIVAEMTVVQKATNLDGALSNILRVNRTKLGLVGSYLIAHDSALRDLLRDRAEGTKSGRATEVGKRIGVSGQTVMRALDELERLEAETALSRREALDFIANDLGYRAGFPKPERRERDTEIGTIISTTADGGVAPEDDAEEVRDIPPRNTPQPENGSTKRDRRVKVTPEMTEAVLASLAEGTSQRATAEMHGINESTVRRIAKAAKPAPDKEREDAPPLPPTHRNDDPVIAKLLAMWGRYGGKEVTPDLFYRFIKDSMSLSNTCSYSVVQDIRPELPIG